MGTAGPDGAEVEPHPPACNFVNAPTAPSEARAWLREVLGGHIDDDTLYDTQLLLSELVTNSHRHTQTEQIHVAVLRFPGLVRVEVSDDKSGRSLPRIGNDCDDGGRGLGEVVGLFAADWGVVVHTHRVTVWFEMKTG